MVDGIVWFWWRCERGQPKRRERRASKTVKVESSAHATLMVAASAEGRERERRAA